MQYSCWQVGEMKTNKIRVHRISHTKILIRLCFLHVHSPCICLLLAINPDYTGVLHVGRFGWGFLSHVISLIFKRDVSFFQDAS